MSTSNAHPTPSRSSDAAGTSGASTRVRAERAPRATVLTIGDELLFGDIVDSNSAFLGRRCRELGLEVVRKLSVRDRVEEIVEALHEAAQGSEVILTSGGLGPTTDDLTAMAVARAAGVDLERHVPTVARLEAFFSARGRELLEANRKQADLPRGCTVLENPIGTAPGFAVELPRSSEIGESAGACLVACMPGVPREMKKMMREQIEPRLEARHGIAPHPRRVYRTLGRGESAVQEMIRPFLDEMRQRSPGLANVIVHYRAHMPEVLLTLEAAPGDDGAQATAEELEALDGPLAEVLGRELYGMGDLPLTPRLLHALERTGLTLATAESCTGGRIGALITDVPGSSAVYVGGVVSYAEAVKAAALGVPEAVLAEHGAVSAPVARAMAEGARTRLRADVAVSVTGLAGPGGGTEATPVGTLHFGVSLGPDITGGEPLTVHRHLKIPGANRELIRSAATHAAIRLVWDQLVERKLADVRHADRREQLED